MIKQTLVELLFDVQLENVSVTQAADLIHQETTELEQQLAEMQQAEKTTSDAYLRIRTLLNAFDTPHAPTLQQIYDLTESKVLELKGNNEALREALTAIFDLGIGVDTFDAMIIAEEALRQTPAESLAELKQQLAEQVAYSQHLKSKIPYGITFDANPSPALLAKHDAQVIEEFVEFYRENDSAASIGVLRSLGEYFLTKQLGTLRTTQQDEGGE